MASRKPKSASDDTAAPVVPPDWRKLVGHNELLQRWRLLQHEQRMPQVLLLSGRAGIGKRSLLAALTAMEWCTSAEPACGICESCQWLLRGAHPEVLWLETQADRYTLDDTARLQEHLSFCAAGGQGQRLAVVCDADKLNLQAANRLLKILEEPPPASRIILSTSRADALLSTVLSRCVQWRIEPPIVEEVVPWLVQQAKLRKIDPVLDEHAARTLLQRSGFSPGRAVQQLALGYKAVNNNQNMWSPASFAEALQIAAESNSDAGEASAIARLSARLDQWEINLNHFYRELFARQERQDPVALRRRRDAMRSARALVQRGKVALNPLLTAEAIALAAVPSRRKDDQKWTL